MTSPNGVAPKNPTAAKSGTGGADLKASPSSGGSAMDQIASFLHSHPKLSLYLLTPGIIEYLSGSSPLYYLVLNPFVFALQLAVIAALYLPGALLIREAMIRWRMGFGPSHGGRLRHLGRRASTRYAVQPAVVPRGGLRAKRIWSLARRQLGLWGRGNPDAHCLQHRSALFLLGLALPETQGKILLASRRSLAGAISVLGLGVWVNVLISLHVSHVWTGAPLFALSLAAVGTLVLAARVMPAGIIHARYDAPRISPLLTGVLGVLVYTSLLLEPAAGAAVNLPAEATFVLVVATLALFLALILRTMGRKSNEKQLIVLSLGMILPVMIAGIATQIFFPIVLIADAGVIIFFWRIWRKHSGGGSFSSARGGTEAGTTAGSPREEFTLKGEN